MSDTGRQGVGEQIQQKVTPDSQKSTTQKISESVTGVYDKAAAALQPEDQKSTTQKASDTARSGTEDVQGEGKGILGTAQEKTSNIAGSASDKARESAGYVSGRTENPVAT